MANSGKNTEKNNEGTLVLENRRGEAVRVFQVDSGKIYVVFRHDNRRVETFDSIKELKDAEISFDLIAETTVAKLRKSPVAIGQAGQLRFVPQVVKTSGNFELEPEKELETRKLIGWTATVQLGLAGLILIGSALFGAKEQKPERVVTLIPKETIEKMLNEEPLPRAREEKPAVEQKVAAKPKPPQKKVVVAPSKTKITKNTPVPTRSTSFKKTAKTQNKAPLGGGYVGNGGKRGYGTNETNMNQIGALAAFNGPRVKGGNGGRGGLNLQAVGSESGSGAGGHGQGGFGSNGSGSNGKGGLGTGKGSGLANAMYGKGLIAAPAGDGGGAPGSGGYGTRGRAGGGAQGAGYGSETLVGSWKGTGPKGSGPAGSGAGNGNPFGSPFGSVDGNNDDMVVTGGLDEEQIAAVIARNMGQIIYCYEQGLQKQPALSGRVAVRWQIGGNGRVEFAKVANSSVRSSQVEGCIASKVRSWQFPKPQGGVSVAVTKPFQLRRVAQR